MTTRAPQLLYLLPEDLYRVGNSTEPRLTHIRDGDVDLYQRGTMEMVRANGMGVSVITEARLMRTAKSLSGWVWKLPVDRVIPTGLALSPDMRFIKPGDPPDHYFICPVTDMMKTDYVKLLTGFANSLRKVYKL